MCISHFSLTFYGGFLGKCLSPEDVQRSWLLCTGVFISRWTTWDSFPVASLAVARDLVKLKSSTVFAAHKSMGTFKQF